MSKKINILSNESDFCMNIAHENSSLEYNLNFPINIKDLDHVKSDIVIVDLNDNSFNSFEILKKDFILIGVMNKLNKKIEKMARVNGYDIVFTKKIFISNYKMIMKQAGNA